MDETGHSYTLDHVKKSIPEEQVDALIDEIRSAGKYQEDGHGYVRPDIWRHQGDELKIKRADKRKRQKDERKDKELAMKMQKEEEEEKRRFISFHILRSSRSRPLEMERSSEDEEEEEEEDGEKERKGPEKKKRSSLSAALWNNEPSSQLPAWNDAAPPELSLQDNGPDKDFAVHLEEEDEEDEEEEGGGGGDSGGDSGGGGKMELEEEDPEADFIDIMPRENTVATELGRLYVHAGNGDDDSEAAKAAAAATAATAASPEAPNAGIKNASESSSDIKEYHDAVEILDEDTIARGEEGAVSLLDPSFADCFFDKDSGNPDAASLAPQQQNKTANAATRRLPMNPRRSNKGKQDAKAVLEAAAAAAAAAAAQKNESLIDTNGPHCGAGAGAPSLPTTEELTDHDHGTAAAHLKEEETSSLKYRQSQGARAYGGGRAALNKHTHFDESGDPIGEGEDIEIRYEDEQPPAQKKKKKKKKKPLMNAPASAATGKRKNTHTIDTATVTKITANGRNPPTVGPYQGEYAFDIYSQGEHEQQHQQQQNVNTSKKKLKRITPAHGNANRISNYGAGKSPPMSPRRRGGGGGGGGGGGIKFQKGPRTQRGHQMASTAAKLKKAIGNNGNNTGQNNQRRGWGGGEQRKPEATVDLTEEPASPSF